MAPETQWDIESALKRAITELQEVLAIVERGGNPAEAVDKLDYTHTILADVDMEIKLEAGIYE